MNAPRFDLHKIIRWMHRSVHVVVVQCNPKCLTYRAFLNIMSAPYNWSWVNISIINPTLRLRTKLKVTAIKTVWALVINAHVMKLDQHHHHHRHFVCAKLNWPPQHPQRSCNNPNAHSISILTLLCQKLKLSLSTLWFFTWVWCYHLL